MAEILQNTGFNASAETIGDIGALTLGLKGFGADAKIQVSIRPAMQGEVAFDADPADRILPGSLSASASA
jgi:hypothetical protein